MRIKDIIKETQPVTFSKIKKKNKGHSKLGLTERDIHELMSHSSYKRGYGGAIRQVR
ncbi:hypothetical protein [Clostridium sp. UBA5712]|uniref:hypothetical protein n=1 Tax=Clostridium sp. UBA5712 TaxID=1946368 RepID=UPI0032177488